MRRWPTTLLLALTATAYAQAPAAQAEGELLFHEVRVLDTARGSLGAPTQVLVRGNRIAAIGAAAQPTGTATTIDGRGRTLMPGLIDVHWHSTYAALSMATMTAPDATPEKFAGSSLICVGKSNSGEPWRSSPLKFSLPPRLLLFSGGGAA